MANWPPNPNQNQNNNSENQPKNQPQQGVVGQEWQIIEKTMLASIEEQKKSRRWNTIFKVLTFAYLFIILVSFGRSCSQNPLQPGSSSPHIAVVDVKGAIAENNEANAPMINYALREAFESPNSKAVVMNINSPGGSPVQSDEVWQQMRKLKKDYPDKKLYAYIGDMGASGAYYIASAADEIWVNNSSLVGSIGVIMPNYDLAELADKLGVKDRTMTAGDHKNILSMTKPIDEFEKQHVEGVLNNVHQHFINAVKEGRGNRLKNVEANKTFTGLFWTGQQAIKIGLADKVGSIRDIAQTYELDEFVNYTPIDPMEELLGGLSLKLGQGIGATMGDKIVPQASSFDAQPVIK